MLNLQAKTSYHIFDEYGMLLVKDDPLSWRDSIGATVCAWIAYNRLFELSNALEDCYDPYRNILFRHQIYDEEASRDHKSYFCIYRKLNGEEIPNFGYLRGMSLWMKSISGNKHAEWWYYFWYIPGAYLGNWTLKTLRWIGNIKPERDNNWWISQWSEKYYVRSVTQGNVMLFHRTRWQKFWAWVIFKTIPAYSLHVKAWQIYVMPKSKKKEKLKRILLKRVGKSNLMLRLLFAPDKPQNSGDSVTQEEVDNYPHMTSFRPGVYLDETCRRNIREMTSEESSANCYERDLILYLWKQKQKSLLIELMEEDEELY